METVKLTKETLKNLIKEQVEETEFDPEGGDWSTEDHKNFYQYGKLVLSLNQEMSEEDVWEAIDVVMKKDNFWPNVFWISDHGNAHLMERTKGKQVRLNKLVKEQMDTLLKEDLELKFPKLSKYII